MCTSAKDVQCGVRPYPAPIPCTLCNTRPQDPSCRAVREVYPARRPGALTGQLFLIWRFGCLSGRHDSQEYKSLSLSKLDGNLCTHGPVTSLATRAVLVKCSLIAALRPGMTPPNAHRLRNYERLRQPLTSPRCSIACAIISFLLGEDRRATLFTIT